MVLFGRSVLARHPGAAILGEVKCSQTLYDDIAKHGGRPIMWKTGHSLIKAKMKEEQALLAGEMSGHMFFADRYFGYDDAIYASLRLLEIVARLEGRPRGDARRPPEDLRHARDPRALPRRGEVPGRASGCSRITSPRIP
jgi:phosphomannomutase